MHFGIFKISKKIIFKKRNSFSSQSANLPEVDLRPEAVTGLEGLAWVPLAVVDEVFWDGFRNCLRSLVVVILLPVTPDEAVYCLF